MPDRDGPARAVDVHALRAAARLAAARAGRSGAGRSGAGRSGAGWSGAGQPRAGRHARPDGAHSLPALAARVAAGAVALALAVLVGVRWADSTAPAAPRDLPGRPLPAGQEVPIPVDRGPSLTEVDVPARARADEMLRRAVRATADWAAVLRELDERRARALAGGHAAGLTLVYAAGSSALREDASDVARLAAAGVRARGLRLVISSVRLRDTAPGRVVLDVRDRMPAYDIVDISGKVVRRLPGRGDRSWQVTLVPSYDVEGEWRIALIARGPG